MHDNSDTLIDNPGTEFARRQAAIVQALNRSGAVPAGFDAAQVEATADSLVRKRARAVQRIWPMLASALEPDYVAKFAAYAAANPPTARGANYDGYQFARWLKSQGRLPEAARIEFAIRQVSFGFPLRLLWLRGSRLAWVYRIGGVVRVSQISLPWHGRSRP